MIVVAPISKKPMTYDEAVLYCVFCRYDDNSDWRLPTKKEYHESNVMWRSWYQNEVIDGSVYNAMPVRDI
jgi:hypothetical protein